jgi:hypothetical protein
MFLIGCRPAFQRYAASTITAIMMEAAHTFEMSVDIQLRTRQYISEDSELHTSRRENLKSHCTVTAQSVTEVFQYKEYSCVYWDKSLA